MIFLGAGASAPFKIPTSPKLTQKMESFFNEETVLLEDIKSFLKEEGKYYGFENVLTILQVLTNPLEVSNNHYTQRFRRIHFEHIKDHKSLINNLYKTICDFCTAPFIRGKENYLNSNELENIFELTYDPLIGIPLEKQRSQIILSTNYDPSIEIWCHRRFISCCDGTKDINNPDFRQLLSGIGLRNEINKLNIHDQSTVPLVRLHGSVWSYKTINDKSLKFSKPSNNLRYPDLYIDELNNFPALIYPGQEEKIRSTIWDPYYQIFREKSSEHCLFIGYSFRHDEINEPILRFLETNQITNMGVLNRNPDRNLENLFQGRPIPERKIIKMPAEFGTIDAIEELNNKWFPIILGNKYKEVEEILQEIKEWKKARKRMYI